MSENHSKSRYSGVTRHLAKGSIASTVAIGLVGPLLLRAASHSAAAMKGKKTTNTTKHQNIVIFYHYEALIVRKFIAKSAYC